MKHNGLKKSAKWVVAMALTFTLAACSTNTPQPTAKTVGAYKQGTYKAESAGNNGPVEVEVTVSTDKITEIKVIQHKETEGIGNLAVDQIPNKIIESQSLRVDTVSGATVTSKAILAAVEDCVKQAGGDVEALKIASVVEKEKENKELTTDVVVVGGGAAGSSATIRAEELGLDTILLEKQSFLGGALSVSGGNQVVMGSQLQKQAGVSDDSVDRMVADFLKNGANLNIPELITLYAENVGSTTDWLNQSVNVEFNMEGGLHKLAEYSSDRELAYTNGGAGAAKSIRSAVEASGSQVLLNTRALELITNEQGAVVGVKATDDATQYTIHAKAVILATGGYGNNKELLSKEMQSALYYGPASSTGDGIVMATTNEVNAATRLMEYGKRYPNGIEVSSGIAKSTIAGNIAAFSASAILVNTQGQRVVNEKSSNRDILTVQLEQKDQMFYLLMDAASYEAFYGKQAGYGGVSDADIATWLKNNGSTTPVFAHADTLAKVAELVGIEGTTLEETVTKYNEGVKNKKDEFGRSADYLKASIGEGPYYLIEQKPRFATTMGGLVVSTSLEVKNTTDQVIPGLYAAGETVGGIMGDDSPSGANNGWALTSGKLAAEAIAKNNEVKK